MFRLVSDNVRKLPLSSRALTASLILQGRLRCSAVTRSVIHWTFSGDRFLMKTPFAIGAGLLGLMLSTVIHAADVEISADISADTTLVSSNRYIITTEVHVKQGVTLTIENNTLILIRNGVEFAAKPTSTRRPSLIFDTGSTMLAEDVYFKACDDTNQPVNKALNAGLFLLGSSSMTRRDLNIMTSLSVHPSFFKANRIHTEYLGARDPFLHQNKARSLTKQQKLKLYQRIDDFDAIQIIGVNGSEWDVASIYSLGSGDDGFDLEDCAISVKNVQVAGSTEDGLNLTNSRLDITGSLDLNVGITGLRDRDLFDLEVDRAPSIIRIAQNAQVRLDGIFGDQAWLRSDDLPHKNQVRYQYNGKTVKGQSYVYSVNKD